MVRVARIRLPGLGLRLLAAQLEKTSDMVRRRDQRYG